jgi:hypothetical protein
MELLRAYGQACDLYFPLVKANSQNFAVSGDYTHASGDVKISKDGGAAATATNSPSAITMGNGAMWKLTLTATEMQAALVMVTVIDATTKAVEDQMILISTYGNSSAQHEFNLDAALTAGAIADAVLDDAISEPGAVFAWGSATLRNIIGWMGLLSRNKFLQTNSQSTIRNDADSADIATSAITFDGTTLTRDEWT